MSKTYFVDKDGNLHIIDDKTKKTKIVPARPDRERDISGGPDPPDPPVDDVWVIGVDEVTPLGADDGISTDDPLHLMLYSRYL